MSESFAVALYAWVGLVCSVLLLRALLRRLVPSAPPWVLLVSTVGLALTNTLPFLLRRPIQYEVAIACGFCFEMAGLWLMVTSVLGPELRRWRMIAGSLCLGLAIGGRPTLAVGGAVAVAAAALGAEASERHLSHSPEPRNPQAPDVRAGPVRPVWTAARLVQPRALRGIHELRRAV